MRNRLRLLLPLAFCPPSHAEEVPPLYIEGYSGAVSYAPGEELALHISTTAPKYSIEIARLGAGRKVVWRKDGLAGAEHAVPENASSHGCGWPVSIKLPVLPDWQPGYYEAKLSATDGGGRWTARGRRTAEGSAWFIVRSRPGGARPRVLLQLSTNTYNAYNNWGGFSLYAYNGRAGVQGHRVSFDRPGGSQFARWEQPFAAWCERNGYELDYAANSDLEFHPEILEGRALVLSVGHDEYWSAPMRDHLEGFIGKGGNVAFFSGNTCCWQVRSEESGRALTCWKQNFHSDPVYQTREYSTLSSLWSHHLVKRPENRLTGVGFLWGGYRKSHGQFMAEPAEYTVHQAGHWMLAGTGLERGAVFGGKDEIVGYECDGCELEWKDGVPKPTHRDGTPASFEVVASCPARWHPDDAEWYEQWEKGRTGQCVLGGYTRGGTVITTGSTDWAHGLRTPDPVVARITRNVLEKLGRGAG